MWELYEVNDGERKLLGTYGSWMKGQEDKASALANLKGGIGARVELVKAEAGAEAFEE